MTLSATRKSVMINVGLDEHWSEINVDLPCRSQTLRWRSGTLSAR